MGRFTIPRDVYHGEDALATLKTLEGKKAMVCYGGGSIERNGNLDKILSYLKEAGLETEIFNGIEPDPSVETVMRGAEAMRKFEPDWIIAIGGGSPIDASKAMWVKYEHPEITFEDMCKIGALPKLRQKSKFCAISTTSGTGTEVTSFAVITNYDEGIKYPMADFQLTPDIAIVDPALVASLPPKGVAHTGMDALTHCIEAYVSTNADDFTDPLAIFGILDIQKHLVKSYNGDMDSRAHMHNAQCIAGMSFSNASLGIVHSMAHKSGATFEDHGAHIIHGCANAIYLTKVIQYNAKEKAAAERYAQIADFMHLGGSSVDEKVELLVNAVRKFNDDLNIPQGLKNLDAKNLPAETGFIPEDVFLERLSDMAERAVGDACTFTNPRPITPKQMEELYKCCYYDTPVDF